MSAMAGRLGEALLQEPAVRLLAHVKVLWQQLVAVLGGELQSQHEGVRRLLELGAEPHWQPLVHEEQQGAARKGRLVELEVAAHAGVQQVEALAQQDLGAVHGRVLAEDGRQLVVDLAGDLQGAGLHPGVVLGQEQLEPLGHPRVEEVEEGGCRPCVHGVQTGSLCVHAPSGTLQC